MAPTSPPSVDRQNTHENKFQFNTEIRVHQWFVLFVDFGAIKTSVDLFVKYRSGISFLCTSVLMYDKLQMESSHPE